MLAKLVASGKVRFVGLSNETPWGVMSFLRASERHGLPRPVSIQNAYNLVNRSFETGLSEIFYREQVSLLAYSPLGQGYLSGKYEGGALPPGSRKTLFDRLGRYEKGNGPRAISTYIELARKHGLDPAQMAIAFAVSRPFVTSTIIGATTMEQLKTDIDAAELKLSRTTCLRTSSRSTLTIRTHALDSYSRPASTPPCPGSSPPSKFPAASPSASRCFAPGFPARAGSIRRTIT